MGQGMRLRVCLAGAALAGAATAATALEPLQPFWPDPAEAVSLNAMQPHHWRAMALGAARCVALEQAGKAGLGLQTWFDNYPRTAPPPDFVFSAIVSGALQELEKTAPDDMPQIDFAGLAQGYEQRFSASDMTAPAVLETDALVRNDVEICSAFMATGGD